MNGAKETFKGMEVEFYGKGAYLRFIGPVGGGTALGRHIGAP